ncbi:hypothetical protein TNCT_208651 [Trichonephila clavata]|uniref:Uncharacterized protein n=1 Tax=Trichonephila clavata TaxID=2740835 RepID=A0A8X6I6P7_TRICU|nr:hypothetical protein TNCT_208651 [Trichonephila clavata]
MLAVSRANPRARSVNLAKWGITYSGSSWQEDNEKGFVSIRVLNPSPPSGRPEFPIGPAKSGTFADFHAEKKNPRSGPVETQRRFNFQSRILHRGIGKNGSRTGIHRSRAQKLTGVFELQFRIPAPLFGFDRKLGFGEDPASDAGNISKLRVFFLRQGGERQFYDNISKSFRNIQKTRTRSDGPERAASNECQFESEK